MKFRTNQSGFELASLAAVVLLVAVIGFAGYKVWQRDSNSADTATKTSTQASTAVPATIDSQADLSSTAKSLDDASPQVNSDVNGDSLDADINDLL